MMTMDEKVEMLRLLTEGENLSAGKMEAYLSLAEKAILARRYAYDKAPSSVPEEYEPVQIQAVLNGFGISGAEGQTAHSENGVSRTFKYPDMLAYINANVVPFVGVV
jgi:hypothetical protein